MYEKIRSHPSPVKVYGNKLIAENTITNDILENSIKNLRIYLTINLKMQKIINQN